MNARTEAGMALLEAEGLDLAALDEGAVLELLPWTPATNLPDADLLVLLQVAYEDGGVECHQGWWDGQAWRYAESGGLVGSGTVRFYADPRGPQA